MAMEPKKLLMAPAFQKSLKLKHFIINYGRIYFLKLDHAISLQQKKIINHHDKQCTPSESSVQDDFFEPGFEMSSHSNHRARILTMLWPLNQGEHLDRLIYRQPLD